MSDDGPIPIVKTDPQNQLEDGNVRVPVRRGPGFVRLAANAFNTWFAPPGPTGGPTFNVLIQVAELKEVAQILTIPPGTVVKKETVLEIEDLASMMLTVASMRALKDSIDTAWALWEQHQKSAGGGNGS